MAQSTQMSVYLNLVEMTEKCEKVAKIARELKIISNEILSTAVNKRLHFTIGNLWGAVFL